MPQGKATEGVAGTKNFDRKARAVAHMPDGRTLRFPVQGTSRRNAVMTAVDDSGRPVFRIRKVQGARRGPERGNWVEICRGLQRGTGRRRPLPACL